MSDFVDTPMSAEFVKTPAGYKGGPGTYDGDDCPGFSEFRRTKSPNAVPEKVMDGSVPAPSGESDQF
jgi:hypothetical protein